MDASVKKVDGYSKLAAHTDEYIYFRTDHHWTQLGAYYAYTAFCEAARIPRRAAGTSLRPAEVDAFLGSMYTFTERLPPESRFSSTTRTTVDYYLPLSPRRKPARYYLDGATLHQFR